MKYGQGHFTRVDCLCTGPKTERSLTWKEQRKGQSGEERVRREWREMQLEGLFEKTGAVGKGFPEK